jgi:hypothetical protein
MVKKGQLVTYQTTRHQPFMEQLANVMEDSSFKLFFDENFGTWDDCKAVLMVMKAYTVVRKRMGDSATKEEVITTLKALINQRDSRKQLCNTMQAFMEGYPVREISGSAAGTGIPELDFL